LRRATTNVFPSRTLTVSIFIALLMDYRFTRPPASAE
jgi:hypothetical protein